MSLNFPRPFHHPTLWLGAAGLLLGTPSPAQSPKKPAPAVTRASAAEDIAKVEKVLEAIRKLDQGMLDFHEARAKASGQPPDSPGMRFVHRHYKGHTRQWANAVAAAKASLKSGNLQMAVAGFPLMAENEYHDTWMAVQRSQLGKTPKPWDDPQLTYDVAILRLMGGLLGRRIPDPITPQFLQIMVQKKPAGSEAAPK